MKRALVPLLLAAAVSGSTYAQEIEATPRAEKRSWISRMFHPFAAEPLPEYRDVQLRGLVLSLRVAQPVKLSETRQMEVTITLTNRARRPITLEFPSAQRFEIYLRTSAGKILTTWSDNHAFADEGTTILINPGEHIQYAETIATRELTANKVFIAEVFFPRYGDLTVRQKFLTAP